MNVAQSSHIQGHEYDPQTKTLLIQFTNGAVYRYVGVDQYEYWNLKQSSSPGTYFHNKIKPKYPGELVSAGRPKRRK
jgi:hypothetical protein